MSPQLPQTYKAAVLEAANGQLEIKEVPLHEPAEGQILIKVLACGVCHTDEHARQGAFGPPPRVLGHEMVGDVVAVGPGEKKWKLGDRVGGPWHGGHDGTCKQCNRGFFQMCDNVALNGITRDGGYAEYSLLRTEAVVRVPADMDPAEAAPLLCAGVTVFNAMRNMHITPGGVVAIQGLGGLGHLALQYARKMGFRTVALSRDNSKKAFAAELGATDYIDASAQDTVQALQEMGGADLVVVTAPNPTIVGQLVGACAVRGKLLVLAPVGEVSIDTTPLIMKGVSVTGWPSGQSLDSEEAIAFAKLQGVKCLVERFPLTKAQEALDYMMSGKTRFRAVLTMGE